MKGKLWAFSGLDGAGKTTQIDLLVKRLEGEGRPIRRVWARGGYTPLFVLAKHLLRKLSARALPKAGRSSKRTKRFQRPLVRKVWLLLSVFDLFLYYGLWVRWLRLTGRTVVSDRWLIDTELDFDLNFPEENYRRWISWKLLTGLVPRPEQHFIFNIPVAESLRRSKEKNEPFPDTAEVLNRRMTVYHEAVVKEVGVEIDGMRSRADTHAFIVASCGLQP